MTEKLKRLLTGEMMRYLFIGGCTTLVNLVCFWAMCRLTPLGGSEAGINAANVVSIAAAIAFAYGANKVVVFHSRTKGLPALLGEMGKFVGARLSTMALEVGGVWLTVSVLHRSPMAGKLATQVLVILGNYFLSKWFVFRGTGENQA